MTFVHAYTIELLGRLRDFARSERLKATGNFAYGVELVAQIMAADLRLRTGAPDTLAYRTEVGDDLLYGVGLGCHVGEFLLSTENVLTTGPRAVERLPAGRAGGIRPPVLTADRQDEGPRCTRYETGTASAHDDLIASLAISSWFLLERTRAGAPVRRGA